MTLEEQSLIICLAKYINEQEYEFPSDICWNKLLHLSQIHALLPVMGYIAKHQSVVLEKSIQDKLTYMYKFGIMQALKRDYEMQHVLELFNKEKIYHVMFKGYQIKNYYPIPELRTMSDVDLMVKENERIHVDNVLLQDGYVKITGKGSVWSYRKGTVVIEVHVKLASGVFWRGINCEEYFEHAWSYVTDSEQEYTKYFNVDYHFIFLIFHLAKHFYGFGAGIRMFLDIAVYIKEFAGQMNWKYIEEQLKVLGLDIFTQNVLYICKEWFHITCGFSFQEMEQWVYDEFCRYVVAGGVYGYEGNDGGVMRLRKGIQDKADEKISTNKIKFIAIWKHFFPNRLYMRMYLPQVEKYVILLPVAWGIRLFEGFFLRRKNTLRNLNAMDKDIGEVRKQKRFLKYMGL